MKDITIMILKKSVIYKIQLTIAINFISFNVSDEECVMHSKSEIMSHDKADEAIEELVESLISRYQIGLETSKKVVTLFLIVLIYCKCHKISFNYEGSYIDSPDCIKNRKATMNSINKNDNKFFAKNRTAKNIKNQNFYK